MTPQSLSTAKAVGDATATPADIVDALKTVAGDPPKVRASFAKGRFVRGRYTPSPEAAEITRSLSFTRPCDLVGRFSMGGGNPNVPETNGLVLRGFSFRLQGEGHRTDLLMENAPVHFARDLDQMLGFLQARFPGPDGKPDPARVKAFSEANPETTRQAQYVAARPLPGSFAGVAYWAVHAFPVTNDAGETRFMKFRLIPRDGEIVLPADQAAAQKPDFLQRDLEARIARGGFRFELQALLGRPGDPVMDVTERWADEDDRSIAVLGEIEITALAEDPELDGTIFDPSVLADGVGHPPDAMFTARLTAYRLSLAKRK